MIYIDKKIFGSLAASFQVELVEYESNPFFYTFFVRNNESVRPAIGLFFRLFNLDVEVEIYKE